MNYIVNEEFEKSFGFTVNSQNILSSVVDVNDFLSSLPPNLYNSIDFKTMGSMIGAVFCGYLVNNIQDAIVNPIEKGHPDIIPTTAKHEPEVVLRNFPHGLEIKGTIGNVTTGANLRAGVPRINSLTGITWQAHHREVNHLLGIIWDFANVRESFTFPAITGAFFSETLTVEDWGKISGTTGRNTKVCGLRKSGKNKLGAGWVLLYDSEQYITKYTRFLDIPNLNQP
ncbi:MAG TPA: hypothetical protein PK185_02670 [Cyclobacteriaceae bacterium]|nr:hypothetical protein [Cyclobacteriaceae bacterium]